MQCAHLLVIHKEYFKIPRPHFFKRSRYLFHGTNEKHLMMDRFRTSHAAHVHHIDGVCKVNVSICMLYRCFVLCTKYVSLSFISLISTPSLWISWFNSSTRMFTQWSTEETIVNLIVRKCVLSVWNKALVWC